MANDSSDARIKLRAEEWLREWGRGLGREIEEAAEIIRALLAESVPAGVDEARVAWHRKLGLEGAPCPTKDECAAFNAGFAAASGVPASGIVQMLGKRIAWLDSEIRGGGNYEYLSARIAECHYIGKLLAESAAPAGDPVAVIDECVDGYGVTRRFLVWADHPPRGLGWKRTNLYAAPDSGHDRRKP